LQFGSLQPFLYSPKDFGHIIAGINLEEIDAGRERLRLNDPARMLHAQEPFAVDAIHFYTFQLLHSFYLHLIAKGARVKGYPVCFHIHIPYGRNVFRGHTQQPLIVAEHADVPTTRKESVNKKDPADAGKSVRALRNGEPAAIQVPEKKILFDCELAGTRSTIVKDISRWKVHIKHLLYRNGVTIPEKFSAKSSHRTKRFIKWPEEEVVLLCAENKEPLLQYIAAYKSLRKQKLDIVRKIRTTNRSDYHATNMELLCSIPGTGFHTAITLSTEIGDVKRFAGEREIASFIGLIPTVTTAEIKRVPGK
jgi:hypothetical protein